MVSLDIALNALSLTVIELSLTLNFIQTFLNRLSMKTTKGSDFKSDTEV